MTVGPATMMQVHEISDYELADIRYRAYLTWRQGTSNLGYLGWPGGQISGVATKQLYYHINNRNSNLATQNSGYNSKLVGGDRSHVYAASLFALKLSAVDGPMPIGDVAGVAIIAGAAAYDLTQRKFITYTLKNAIGKIYVGRTSGFGDPEKIMLNRYSSHHMRAYGYGNPKLDRVAIGFPVGYYAIRGREQDVVDGYGGVGSSNLGNSINPIFKYNPNKPLYMEASKLMFGQFVK